MLENELKEELDKDSAIVALYLYGSRSSGIDHSRSDTDIAMLLSNEVGKDRYSDYRLKYLSKLKEYVSGELDFIILNQVPPLLQFQVLQHGKLLYEADSDRRALIEVNILNHYYLSKRFYEFHFKNLREHIKEQGLGHGQKGDRSTAEEVRQISKKLAAFSRHQVE